MFTHVMIVAQFGAFYSNVLIAESVRPCNENIFFVLCNIARIQNLDERWAPLYVRV